MTPEVTTRKIAELQALRSQAARWRFGIPVAVIAIITVCILMIYNSAQSLAQPGPAQETFVEEVKKGMDEDVMPIVRHAAYRTFTDTKNAVREEFERISERTPEFATALQVEAENLVHNVPKRTEAELSEILAAALARQELTINELFPNLEEDQVSSVLEQLVNLGKEQAEYVGQQLFEPHLVRINNMIDDLQVIRKSESLRPGDSIDSFQMALLVFDILRDEFDEVHPAPDENRSVKADLPKADTPESENGGKTEKADAGEEAAKKDGDKEKAAETAEKK